MTKPKSRVIQGWRQISPRRATTRESPPDPATDQSMGRNAEFVANMNRMMARWDKEVDLLARSAAIAGAGAGAAYQDGVKELRACRDLAQKAFQEIRFASESEGLELKAGMQAAWARMQSTLEKVTAGLAKK